MLNNIFWIDINHNVEKTYEDLLNDINNARITYPYIKQSDTYFVFLYLLINFINDIDTVIIDYDTTDVELELLNIKAENLNDGILLEVKREITFDHMITLFQDSISKWKLSLFSSGSTGNPKKVDHSIINLIRNVRTSEKYRSNIWGFAYNSTHFAGIQVFFQAFMNKNPMINIFDIKGREIENTLLKFDVTNISATPTFFRTFTPVLTKINDNIKHLTFGGEKFDVSIKEKLSSHFVNAKFHNIYASTEAGTLLTSNGAAFLIPDKYKTKIKISENNELLIHYSLLGKSNNLKFNGDWYHSGDIIEKIEGDNFIIKGRQSDIINVGGYNVSPVEIEESIRGNDFVIDVLVKGRSNKLTGNIIVADIVKKELISKPELRNQLLTVLKKRFQSYKIPRIINFVEEIEKSRTGKIKRL